MDLVNCSRCEMLYFVCWGGCLFKFVFSSVVSQINFLVQLFLVLLEVYLFVSRSVFQCSGFCSMWLLKYFAMNVEMVGCTRLF